MKLGLASELAVAAALIAGGCALPPARPDSAPPATAAAPTPKTPAATKASATESTPKTEVTAAQAQKVGRGTLYIVGDSEGDGAVRFGHLKTGLEQDGWSEVVDRVECGRPMLGGATYTGCGETANPLTAIPRINEDAPIIRRASEVVVILGANEAGNGSAYANKATRQVVDAIHVIKPDVPVEWVNVYFTDMDMSDINGAIKSAVGPEHVIDWASRAQQHPEYFAKNPRHSNAAGFADMAQLIIETVRS